MISELFFTYFKLGIIGTIIILVFLVVRKFINKRFLSISINIWLLILLTMIIPFKVPITIPVEEKFMQLTKIDLTNINEMASNIQTEGFSKSIIDMALFIIPYVWVVGMLVVGFKYYKLIWFFRKVLKFDYQCENRAIKTFNELCDELKIKNKPGFRESMSIGSPFIIGFLKPKIYLTDYNYTDEELTWILKHELIHFKRKHLLYKLVANFANIIFWYNPLIFMIKGHIDEDCEMACDEEVLKDCNEDDRTSYLKAVASNIIYKMQGEGKIINTFGTKEDLKNRIMNVKNLSNKTKGTPILVIATILAAMSFITIEKVPAQIIEKPKVEANTQGENENISEKDKEEENKDSGSIDVNSLSNEEFQNLLRNTAKSGMDKLKKLLNETGLEYSEEEDERYINIFVNCSTNVFKVALNKGNGVVGVFEI